MQSLSSHHTFGFDAACERIQPVESIDDIMRVLAEIGQGRFMLLGEGSNTIFIEDYQGTILLNQLKGISVFEDEDFYHINAASGENWHEFVKYCLDKDIHGLENLALIPGTVGAAPIQNIGAYGVEINQFIHSVEFVDVDTQMMGYFNNKECEFGYRDSIFKRSKIGKRLITSVNFAIPKSFSPVVHYAPLNQLTNPSAKDIFDTVISTRQSKLPDPKQVGNAGSFFKNPVIGVSHYIRLQGEYPELPNFPTDDNKVKVPAAWLIDELGFKSKPMGNVSCHPNQALVLINQGGGTGEELLALASQIKHDVFQNFNIHLEPEVRLIGRTGPISI